MKPDPSVPSPQARVAHRDGQSATRAGRAALAQAGGRACLECRQSTLLPFPSQPRVISKKLFMGFFPVGKEVIGNTLISKMQKIKPPAAQSKLQKPAGAAWEKLYLKQEAEAHHQIGGWKEILFP